MSDFKGTKGEWKANIEHKFYNGNKAFEINYGRDGECVAEIVHNLNDAKIIAAAPELLDALIETLSYLDSIQKADAEEMLFFKIKQLIKKATE